MINMKKITKLFSLVLGAMFTLIFLSACGGDHELVGTWIWNDNDAWTYTFNSDGTGIRGDGSSVHPVTEFEWSIYEEDGNEGELHLTCPIAMFGVDIERWDFSVNNDVLILNSLQGGGQNLRYNRE